MNRRPPDPDHIPDALDIIAGVLDAVEHGVSGVTDDLYELIPADRRDHAVTTCWTHFIFTERLRDEAARLREYAAALRKQAGGAA